MTARVYEAIDGDTGEEYHYIILEELVALLPKAKKTRRCKR